MIAMRLLSPADRLAHKAKRPATPGHPERPGPLTGRSPAGSNPPGLFALFRWLSGTGGGDLRPYAALVAGRTFDAAQRPLRRVPLGDRKSTRLNSRHLVISYAVFFLK